jgi:hypothetical protein
VVVCDACGPVIISYKAKVSDIASFRISFRKIAVEAW